MSGDEQNEVANWLISVGREFDRRERRPNAHQEIFGEVYPRVVAEFDHNEGRAIKSPEAFVRAIGWKEFHRAYGRERDHAQRHTPTASDVVLEKGVVPRSHQLPSSCTSPLDVLIRQEELSVLVGLLGRLSETDAQLVRTLPRGSSSERSFDELARQSGKSVRTLQRRRERLVVRLQQILSG